MRTIQRFTIRIGVIFLAWNFSLNFSIAQTLRESLLQTLVEDYAANYSLEKRVFSLEDFGEYFINLDKRPTFSCLEKDSLQLQKHPSPKNWSKLLEEYPTKSSKKWPNDYLKKFNTNTPNKSRPFRSIQISEPILFENRALIYFGFSGGSQELRLYEFVNGQWNYICLDIIRLE